MPNIKKYQIPLFHPYINKGMKIAAYTALGEKIIGQGDKVDEFEKKLCQALHVQNLLTVNSATSALELAYHMLNLKPGDEVISPVFTCIATNISLVRQGIKIVFSDILDNLLLDWTDVQKKITAKTKAIINVHLFGQHSKAKDLGIPIIGDSAQYLDKTYGERFTAYSFQATKAITTVDGGALVCQKPEDYKRAKLLRWYGIDRETDKDNIEVDITEAGFKYHMNDVTASIGIAALKHLKKTESKIAYLQKRYFQELKNVDGITPIGGSPFLIHTKNRDKLIKKLSEKGIEAGLIHKRNDLYSVFGGKRLALPNMNRVENIYLFLPCRVNMAIKNIEYICSAVKKI